MTTATTRTSLADLAPYHRNPRRGNIESIAASLQRLGQYKPIVVNRGTKTGRPNEVLAGNHTLAAARHLGWDSIETHYIDVDDDTAARIVLADNRTSDLGTYDDQTLVDLLENLPDLDGVGYSPADLEELRALLDAEDATPGSPDSIRNASGSLAEQFGAPPFTVLDARSGAWRKRATHWKNLGIRSELGRDADLIYTSPQAMYTNWYQVKRQAEAEQGHELDTAAILAGYAHRLNQPLHGTSIFNPVLAELAYRWFSATGDRILDPWAGGSVRGIVAAMTGRTYTGIELRPAQVESNRQQWAAITAALPDATSPDAAHWIEGDARTRLAELPDATADMLIGCPPYYDLEQYSDSPQDLSNLTREQFDAEMHATIAEAARVLRNNAFAVLVVGAVRDEAGHIIDMRRLMTDAFTAAGMHLYHDAILLTPAGSAAVRAPRQFRGTRMLTRVHQEVLVYGKGEETEAAARITGEFERLRMLTTIHEEVLVYIKGDRKQAADAAGDATSSLDLTFATDDDAENLRDSRSE